MYNVLSAQPDKFCLQATILVAYADVLKKKK